MLVAPDLSLVYIMVLFGIAYLVLKNLFFRPIVAVLDERAREVEEADRLHREALEQSRVAIGEAEERFGEVRRRAIRQREEARNEGRQAREGKLGEARQEAEKIIGREREAIEKELPALRQELEKEADRLADEVAARILGRRADA